MSPTCQTKAPRICDECQGITQPLLTHQNPSASEFYCAKCHVSYLMTKDDFDYWKRIIVPRNPREQNGQ